MSVSKFRRTVIASTVLLISGCATAPGQPGFPQQFKQAFASDDPCSNNSRNIGIVGGALLGVVLGNAMGGGDDGSKLVGAALGGALGGVIGADMDRKRCEISKVAKKYDLDISFANIELQGAVQTLASNNAVATQSGTSSTSAVSVIGNTVTVRDKDGTAGHFESGSEKLTSKAQEYFYAIATQYAPETAVEAQSDPKRKQEMLKQLGNRRFLLVGHTDDTGSSQLNANLSERRARAVAAFLVRKGIPESSIYYQGAGESLPTADNRTDAGRATNRRVEIVELADETGFKKYLEMRKPQYAFYRNQPAATPSTSEKSAAASIIPTDAATEKKSAVKKKAATTKAVAQAPASIIGPVIDFGGVPYSANIARIETGSLVPEKGFNLMSKAYADDSVLISDCSNDRPRAVGTVKSLHDGRTYRTTEHLPQLYGKTWANNVNGNLVVINRLAVLRDGGTPANLPELKVYDQYKAGSNKKPMVNEEPAVNSYLVDKGVLYRLFPRGDGGLKCIDVLFGTDGATTAKAGKLIYASGYDRYVADFKPQLQ
jgi:outer membrane protein OmpA-like peptidoglycan-associated protein